jgi:hypothetical protein
VDPSIRGRRDASKRRYHALPSQARRPVTCRGRRHHLFVRNGSSSGLLSLTSTLAVPTKGNFAEIEEVPGPKDKREISGASASCDEVLETLGSDRSDGSTHLPRQSSDMTCMTTRLLSGFSHHVKSSTHIQYVTVRLILKRQTPILSPSTCQYALSGVY